MKKCKKCGHVKPIDDFHKHSSCNGGVRQPCKQCRSKQFSAAYKQLTVAEKAAKIAQHMQWQKQNCDKSREINRRYKRKRAYGLTATGYSDLLTKQDGVCAICNQPETAKRRGTLMTLAVDHDHYTGIVRGLLCQRCNRAIGLLHDDYDILDKAAAYLRTHGKQQEHNNG